MSHNRQHSNGAAVLAAVEHAPVEEPTEPAAAPDVDAEAEQPAAVPVLDEAVAGAIAEAVARQDALTAARQLVAEDERARQEACAAEIEAVLAKWGQRLVVSPSVIQLASAAQ